MPIYEYACGDCKHNEEVFFNKPISEIVDPSECPNCGSTNYHRQMPSSFLFDVVDGNMYNGGRKDYKSRMTLGQAADVIMGKRDPY